MFGKVIPKILLTKKKIRFSKNMLEIITTPTESLRKKSIEIDHDFLLSADIQHFIQELIATMYNDDGVGIASPQVGKNIRICTINKETIKLDKKTSLEAKEDLILVNPVWTKTSLKKNWETEGCLSVPKTYGKVKRYSYISVKAWDKDGKEINFLANNFFARVIQHEIDHLDGILFVDKAKDIYQIE